MPTCDPTTLVPLAACFNCLSRPQLEAIKAYLECVITNNNAVAVPTNPDISAASTAGNTIVTWSQSSAPTTNEVWRSKNGAAYTLFSSVAGGLTQKIDTDAMVALDQWCYEIRACTGSCSSFTSPVCIFRAFQKTVNNGTVTYSFPDLRFHLLDLIITNQAALTTISMPALHTSTDGVAFVSDPVLSSINLNALISCKSLEINTLAALTSMSLPALTTCTVFWVSDNPVMTSLSIPLLNIVSTGNFLVSNNTLLTSLSAPLLTSVAGGAMIGSGSGFTSISFPVLTTVNQLTYDNCPALATISFPQLVTVSNDLSFTNCDSLTAVSFPLLQSADSMSFLGCLLLVSLQFPALTGVNIDISCANCPALTTWNAPNLIMPDNGQLISFGNCALTAASVNQILARCVASGLTSSTIALDGGTNAAPTGQGIIDKTALIVAGNTVTTN